MDFRPNGKIERQRALHRFHKQGNIDLIIERYPHLEDLTPEIFDLEVQSLSSELRRASVLAFSAEAGNFVGAGVQFVGEQSVEVVATRGLGRIRRTIMRAAGMNVTNGPVMRHQLVVNERHLVEVYLYWEGL